MPGPVFYCSYLDWRVSWAIRLETVATYIRRYMLQVAGGGAARSALAC